MNERWLPVVGFEGLYEVSDLGRVRSLARVIAVGKRGARDRGEVILKPNCRGTYPKVDLWKGRRTPALVHRLVLGAFVGPCPTGLEGCHNNGDQQDSRLENLRWDTRKGNHADKSRHGTMTIGERNPFSKLTDELVRAIRRSTLPQRKTAEIFGIHQTTVSDIVSGRHWAHVK